MTISVLRYCFDWYQSMTSRCVSEFFCFSSLDPYCRQTDKSDTTHFQSDFLVTCIINNKKNMVHFYRSIGRISKRVGSTNENNSVPGWMGPQRLQGLPSLLWSILDTLVLCIWHIVEGYSTKFEVFLHMFTFNNKTLTMWVKQSMHDLLQYQVQITSGTFSP